MGYIRIPDKQVVFIRVPKVASSSIKTALLGDGWVGNSSEAPFTHDLLARYPDDFVFAAVRNPWERLVSCYVDKVIKREEVPTSFPKGVVKGMPFADFAQIVAETPDVKSDVHFRSLAWFLFPQGRMNVNFVVRYERLAQDWTVVQAVLSAKGMSVPRKLPVRQRRAREHYARYYTDSLVDLVAERYKRDVRLFGYAFDAAPADDTEHGAPGRARGDVTSGS